MKLTRTETKWILTLILSFHMTLKQADASHDDDDDEVRILVVGVRGQSRLIAAELLSGRKDGGQEDREIVKTPVITDEAGRMMLVTGPNLCEEDPERQTFTIALFLSSPGPHAVLMVLDLEDQQSQQCDIEKRAQELLGAEVLQYCIVLLLQNHQEPFTGESKGMINACGGRFHVIRDSEPKPAQRAALIVEIDKLVWLNDHRFYSVLRQELETEKHVLLQRLREIQNILKEETKQNVKEENPVLTKIYITLAGVSGILGWTFFIVLSTVVILTKGKHKLCNFGATLCVFIILMLTLRNNLSPYVAVPINMTLWSTCVITVTCIELIDLTIIHKLFLFHLIVLVFFILDLALGLILVTFISIKTWSDVLIAYCAAPGITLGAVLSTVYCTSSGQKKNETALTIAFKSCLFCSVGAMLSMGLAAVFCWMFALLGVKMSTILLIVGFTKGCFLFKTDMILLAVFILIPCCCVFIGSSVFVVLNGT